MALRPSVEGNESFAWTGLTSTRCCSRASGSRTSCRGRCVTRLKPEVRLSESVICLSEKLRALKRFRKATERLAQSVAEMVMQTLGGEGVRLEFRLDNRADPITH
jgi:hypothetical protein